MKNYISQVNLAPSGGFKGFGTFGLETQSPLFAGIIFQKFLSTTIGVMTIIAFIWFVIQFFLGAIGILASAGDKAKLVDARSKITSAVIGIVVVVSAIFIIEVIGSILNLPFILNPARFILCATTEITIPICQ